MSNYKLQNYQCTRHIRVKAIQFDGTEDMAKWIVQTFPCFSGYKRKEDMFWFEYDKDAYWEETDDEYIFNGDYIITDFKMNRVLIKSMWAFEERYQMVHTVI